MRIMNRKPVGVLNVSKESFFFAQISLVRTEKTRKRTVQM
jgi:hypothetical protein